jgi:serine/threonine-protein kinase SRPK3
MKDKELPVLLRLAAVNLDHPGKGHVLELLDHFRHDGLNGRQLCPVLPVTLSDGEGMTVNGKPHHASSENEP